MAVPTPLGISTRQDADLQTDLAQSMQGAAHELAALSQEMRVPLRGSQATGVGVDTRLLGEALRVLESQDSWRD